jgi:O-antigen/teichoic acid export membrane protein
MSGQSKLLVNSLSMLVNKLTQGITTFVLTTAIARNFGALALGQYILALSYYYIFVNITSQSFKTLFTREIAREPELTSEYLVSGTLLQFVFSIIGYLALVIVVFLLPYNADTSFICYLMGLTILPFALSNITEAIFQAQEKMYLITISTVPVYILRLLAMIWAMQLNYGVPYIAIILLFSEFLILVIEWLLLTKIIKPKWQINKDFIWNRIKAARTFFALEGIGIIASKLNLLILSVLGSEALVGIYGAITQVIQPFFLVSMSINLAAFPSMSKAVFLGREQQQKITENIIEFLLVMSLPLMAGIYFFADKLLLLIYKDASFSEESMILKLVSIILISTSFSGTFGYLLIANGLEKFNLIETVLTTLVGGISGILLIAKYQLLGSTLMILFMSFTTLLISGYIVYSRLFALNIRRFLPRPLLITMIMIFVFLFFKKTNLEFIWVLFYSFFIYIMLICLLAIREFGGFVSVYKKISSKW